MLTDLTREERNRLFKYLAAAIWADGEAAPEEIDLFTDMLLALKLDSEEMGQVTALLHAKPRVDELEGEVPLKHRQLLVNAVREAVISDGEIGKAEREAVKHIGDALGVPIGLPGDEER